MENIHKYFYILENLRCRKDFPDEANYVKANIDYLQKQLKLETCVLNDLETLKHIKCLISENSSNSWIYSCYLFHILLKIKNDVNFDSSKKEDLISLKNLKTYINTITIVSRNGIVTNLPSVIRQSPIFNFTISHENGDRQNHLKISIIAINEFINSKIILTDNLIDSVVLELMAGIYAYISEIPDIEIDLYAKILQNLWEHRKEKFFKNLLILKSIQNLPQSLQKHLHKELLDKLSQPNGFTILTRNLLSSSDTNEDNPNWKRYDVVSRIVAHRGHSTKFYINMINQILIFIKSCFTNNTDHILIPAGVITLHKIYNINDLLRKEITNQLYQEFSNLINPSDLLTSAIISDQNSIQLLLNILFACFCRTSFESPLPSELLIKYIPLLLTLYEQFHNECNEKLQIKSLILQCLGNREKSELNKIIKNIIFNKKTEPEMFNMHSRLLLRFNDNLKTYNIQVVSDQYQEISDLPSSLVEILKTSNHNILIYNIFIDILYIFLDEIKISYTKEKPNIELLNDDDEFNSFIENNFKNRLTIITCLTNLIQLKSFHSQFHENPNDILNFLKDVFQNHFIDDDTFGLCLSIFREILENSKDNTKYKSLLINLNLKKQTIQNLTIKRQIDDIISLIENGPIKFNNDISKYNYSRTLLQESESHLRVYGLIQMIGLINSNDEETLANKHAILALSLNILHDQESYTYLNCIKLLISLIKILESEVLESLATEYLNKDETLEFRLKVGETILKITEELGPFSYKYKDVLINCFISGSTNEENEFKTSSLSNLATICRLLSYQVHNFFQELVLLIETILHNETYLPTRRAAVMILSELIAGIDNLMNFEDFLLQIYRLLNSVVTNDNDDITKTHANNGLTHLSEKCKTLLLPEIKLEKEIKIFNIKDDKTGKNKNHILELN